METQGLSRAANSPAMGRQNLLYFCFQFCFFLHTALVATLDCNLIVPV